MCELTPSLREKKFCTSREKLLPKLSFYGVLRGGRGPAGFCIQAFICIGRRFAFANAKTIR
jgi:hypothetical protein